jgi:hypothetical protein
MVVSRDGDLQMKTPVVWVTAALTAAIVLTATFLIATGTRGENGLPARCAVSAVPVTTCGK